MSFTANGQYGSYKHALTEKELAYHRHSYAPAWVNKVDTNTGVFGLVGDSTDYNYPGGAGFVGESEPFNIIQPSIGVYRWRRTA